VKIAVDRDSIGFKSLSTEGVSNKKPFSKSVDFENKIPWYKFTRKRN